MSLREIFLSALRNSPLADALDLLTEAEASFRMDAHPIQDSFRYRACHLGRGVAHWVIDPKGELDNRHLQEWIRLLDQGTFILGPGREGDSLIYSHIQACLKQLPDLWPWIRKFSPPLCHKKAEEMVRETLWPDTIGKVETVHVRRAVVTAWLTALRQTTGSCFATAPAILIQRNHPRQFFQDLYDLLSTGQLKRTVAGKEYAVPLNLSKAEADLQRNWGSLLDSPGLLAALEAGGIRWTPDIQAKLRRESSVEKALRSLSLESAGITEEDVADEERLAQLQMTLLLAKQAAVHYQRPTERAVKVSEWKKKLAKMRLAFQAFADCALLRAWEYTMASFCDVKTDFARWNLYIGLGMHPDHKGGVGAFLYEEVNERLQACNREIEHLNREYEREMQGVSALEMMFNSALSDARRHQLKSEWTTQLAMAQSILEARDRLLAKAEAISAFFSSLLRQYDEKLQEYFQELFDSAISGEETHLYDDSIAGFRLVYKHGRKDASQWTPIYTGEEYVSALRDFFSVIEADIQAPEPLDRAWIAEITTALIRFIQEPAFLSAALLRSKEMGKKSAWDYTSGGTMETLLQSYCNRDRPFTEARIVPRSERELLHFLSQEKRPGPLLMHSPTHAFLFYPEALPPDSESLIETAPAEWNELMREHISHRISDRLPEAERALFLHLLRQKPSAATSQQFREHLIEAAGPRIKYPSALIDSVLYEQTPLLPSAQAKEALSSLLTHLGLPRKEIRLEGSFFGSYDLYQLAKASLLESLGTPFSTIDWDLKIAHAMRHLGLGYRHPVLFADTNWSGWFFGFIANPVTGQLELWRLNRNATQGFPMTDWKEWTSPTNTSPWVILTQVKEYTDSFS